MSYIINPYDLYEHDTTIKTLDLSSQGLKFLPDILNKSVQVIYLQDNNIEELPPDFFSSLPNLTWLDLRNNQLSEIPKSIKSHRCLTHLLLQNNNLQELPNELGNVMTIKVLQLGGNPLKYPPRDILSAGTSKVLTFLNQKLIDSELLLRSISAVSDTNDTVNNSNCETYGAEARSYNSVLDINEMNKITKTLSVKFSERDDDSEEDYYGKFKGKCPKLAKCRHKTLSPHNQSSKYLKPIETCNKIEQDGKIIEMCLNDIAIKKRKDFLAKTDRIIQGKKNLDLLRNWRKNYRTCQLFTNERTYKMDPRALPFDTNPDYMTILTREDIEKDLPDKYRKRLVRKCKPSVARKNNDDLRLALKIKQLFANLDAIDIDKKKMTPRTEQKVLLNEIQKISEIKQKLMELSVSNARSVNTD